MSVLLAIDTAAARLQLALFDGAHVEQLFEVMAQGQAERLFPALGELLDRAGRAYADLDRIAVTSGPGSFTGLRIGLSAARGLGLALARPVVGVPSLLALSLAAPAGRPAAVLLDARRGEAYLQLFAAPGDPAGEAMLLPMAAARALVPTGATLLETPFVDLALLAPFAAGLAPAAYPPEAAYVRAADAKPQDRFRVARQ